jgi:hypothetical protein
MFKKPAGDLPGDLASLVASPQHIAVSLRLTGELELSKKGGLRHPMKRSFIKRKRLSAGEP